MIPYGRQDISEADIEAVVQVLRSEYLTQGSITPLFEQKIAAYCGAEYATAVNSATSALHIACLALGLGTGDLVWTSPITFVASANCALYCGAEVDFVDIDPLSYNMSVSALEEKLIQAKKESKLPKIVIPVHLSGQSCDMQAIYKLSQQYGFKIIEDASHAIGGRYLNMPIGNCRYSDITVFSFHPVKIITTAEGGMLLTNQQHLAEKFESLRSHGITRDPKKMTKEPDGAWYYQQIELGFNYRMTELQAALGLSQMDRLDEFVSRRNFLAKRYDEALKGLSLLIPDQDVDCYSARHLYIIRLKLDELSITHRQAFDKLRDRGILVNLHYIPVYTQPYYQQLPFAKEYNFPIAEQYYADAISIPMYSAMTENQQDEVIAALREILA